MFLSNDEEDNQSSNFTHTANVASESEKEKQNTSSRKRKIEELLGPQEFGTWGTNEFNAENIDTGEVKSSSCGIKEENSYFPSPSYKRRDGLYKQLVAQNGTYLDLTNIYFKDHIKVIDDWAQSLSVMLSNYKNIWTKESFLDYLAATHHGDTL